MWCCEQKHRRTLSLCVWNRSPLLSWDSFSNIGVNKQFHKIIIFLRCWRKIIINYFRGEGFGPMLFCMLFKRTPTPHYTTAVHYCYSSLLKVTSTLPNITLTLAQCYLMNFTKKFGLSSLSKPIRPTFKQNFCQKSWILTFVKIKIKKSDSVIPWWNGFKIKTEPIDQK